MTKIQFYIISLSILITHLNSTSLQNLNEIVYTQHKLHNKDKFEKQEVSGCKSYIEFNSKSIVISFKYKCLNIFADPTTQIIQRDTTEHIANSFDALIKHYKLKDKLKSLQYLHITYDGYSLGALGMLNEYIKVHKESWIQNTYNQAKAQNFNEQERSTFYMESLRVLIEESKIYAPLQKKLEQLNCKMSLRKGNFSDGPLYLNTSKNLIRWSEFNGKLGANTTISFKDDIEFNLVCKE